jgi:DNA sulfur modification protein DndB
MENEALAMPALRGSFGDWIFYSCLMPIIELGARVSFAEEIHKDKALSKLIQRALESERAQQIADYLRTEERFFNSLVLATYGGNPEWFEVGDFRSNTKPEILSQISERALDTIGFLRLGGAARLFAIDGQHRLAGIKQALKEGIDFGEEQVSVILVGHKKTQAGLRRTRRLFTTLNKTAIPVRKRDIIALDEDDAMAIVVRRLVENDASFKDPKIAVIASPNIPVGNRVCLTTISSLYDTLRLLFMYDKRLRSDRALRFNRPSDEQLASYEKLAKGFFASLGGAFKPVRDLLKAKNPGAVTEKFRVPNGGHLLFRPIGLEVVTRTAIDLAKDKAVSLPKAVEILKALPTELAKSPYRGVIWDPARKNMIPAGKGLARKLLRFMLGLRENDAKLLREYRISQGVDPGNKSVKLPSKVV